MCERTQRPHLLLWHPSPSRPVTLLNLTPFYSSELVPRTGNDWTGRGNRTDRSLKPRVDGAVGASLASSRPCSPRASPQQPPALFDPTVIQEEPKAPTPPHCAPLLSWRGNKHLTLHFLHFVNSFTAHVADPPASVEERTFLCPQVLLASLTPSRRETDEQQKTADSIREPRKQGGPTHRHERSAAGKGMWAAETLS